MVNVIVALVANLSLVDMALMARMVQHDRLYEGPEFFAVMLEGDLHFPYYVCFCPYYAYYLGFLFSKKMISMRLLEAYTNTSILQDDIIH